MTIIVQQSDEVFHEFSKLEIRTADSDRVFDLDLDFSSILDWSRQPHTRSLDFLVICAVVYAVDKIVRRNAATDLWTRTLQVSIPLREPSPWQLAADDLAQSVSFLTGDSWTFTFTQAQGQFQRRRANRRKPAKGFPNSPVVSLLSGGLDSFIGALDLLTEYPSSRLLFVSHYDRHVSGPASDQDDLRRYLESKFTGRLSHLQVRVGVVPSAIDEKFKFETSFRSRSLIFLGLAVYAANKISDETPVLIPENGPIALNMPLNPSRRGACSTRTVHPFFLKSLRRALAAAGIATPISNPYELKTKGEMLKESRSLALAKEAFPKSNSCAKAGRKRYWQNPKAQACGTCVPCLFRRASLHAIGCDNETFGNDIGTVAPEDYPDFHALLGLLRRKPTRSEIAKSLIANGRLPMDKLEDYSAVIERMIEEVTLWLAAKASRKALTLARIKRVSK